MKEVYSFIKINNFFLSDSNMNLLINTADIFGVSQDDKQINNKHSPCTFLSNINFGQE